MARDTKSLKSDLYGDSILCRALDRGDHLCSADSCQWHRPYRAGGPIGPSCQVGGVAESVTASGADRRGAACSGATRQNNHGCSQSRYGYLPVTQRC